MEQNETPTAVNATWQNARQYIENNYTAKQVAIIDSAGSMSEIVAHLSLLQSQQKRRLSFRRLTKMEPFLDRLRKFDEVLKIFSGANSIVAIVWGSIKLMLELLYQSVSYFDRFFEIWLNISDNLPRVQRLAVVFSDSGRLNAALTSIYADIMEFCILATTTLTRRKSQFWKFFPFSSFESGSKRIVLNLQRHKQNIDDEANLCNMTAAKKEREERLSERFLYHNLEIIKWLNPADTDNYFDNIERNREKGTGEWFLQSQQVSDWLNGVNSVLWVKGIPGCGKTFLCSALIDSIRKTSSKSRLLFFFCDGTSQSKNTSTAILRSLVTQLVAGNQSLIDRAFQWVIKSGQERATSFKTLLDMFRELLQFESNDTYLVIDALDECKDCRQTFLLSEFRRLIDQQQQPKILAIIFSRLEPWILQDLKSCTVLEVTSQAIQEDMSLFIKRSLRRPPLSMIQDTRLERRIMDTLRSKAQGQFLWVRLMIGSLRKSTFISDIEHALQNLPLGLGQAYGRILENLLAEGKQRRKAGHILLQWLTCAERPLTLTELGTALAIRPGAVEIDASDRVVDLPNFLEELCGSLVKVSVHGRRAGDATVSFVHLTVKEYLTSSEELWSQNAGSTAQFRIEASIANSHLASICITHLTSEDFLTSSEELRGDNESAETPPFNEYASFYWATHLAHSGAPTPEILRLLKTFLSSEQLSRYLETTINGSERPTSIISQTQGYLNTWIRKCDPNDPRLEMVLDCFRNRFEKTYQHRSNTLGLDHLDTLEAGYQFAKLLHVRGEWSESEKLHRKVMEARMRTMGSNDVRCLDSMDQLSRILTRFGKHHESRPLQEQVLAKRKEISGANSVIHCCRRILLRTFSKSRENSIKLRPYRELRSSRRTEYLQREASKSSIL